MADEILYNITFEGLDDSVKKTQRLNQQLIEQKDVVSQTKKEIKALENERKKEGQLTAEQSAKLEKLNKDLLNQQQGLKDINTQRRSSIKESENFNKALQSEIGSNEQLKGELAILTKRYNSLSAEQREGSKAGQDLQKEILGITNKLKGNEKAVGDNRRNVGNYEEAITSALGKVNIMGVNLGQLTTQIKSGVQSGKALATTMVQTATATTAQATATKGATVATGGMSKALKFFKIALASTGIGLIVVALSSLVAGLATTQKGMDAISRVMEPVKAIASTLFGLFQDFGLFLGGGFVNALKSPGDTIKNFGIAIRDNLINRPKGAWKFLKGYIKTVVNGFKSFGLGIKLALADVPIIGKGIDKDQVKKDLDEAKAEVIKGTKEMANGAAQAATGIEDPFTKAANAARNFGSTMLEAKEKGDRLAEIKKELNAASIELARTEGKANDEIERAKNVINDQTASEEDRRKALDDAKNAINEKFEAQEALKRLELEEMAVKQSLNDTSDEEKLAYEELTAELDKLSASRQKELNLIDKKEQTINRQIEAEKKASAKAWQDKQKELKRLEKQEAKEEQERLEQIAETNRSEIEALEYKREQKLKEFKLDGDIAELTQAELKARGIINEEYDNMIAKINETEQAKRDALLLAEEREVIDKQIRELEFSKNRLLENDKLTADERLQIENKFQQDKAQIELDALTTQAERIKRELEPLMADAGGGLVSPLTDEEEQKLMEQLNAIDSQMAKIGETINGVEGEEEEGEGIKLQNALGLDDEGMEKLLFSFSVIRDALSSISGLMDAVTERNKKNIQEQVKAGLLSQEEADKKLEQIEKRAFKRNKAFNIATAITNTAQAVASTLAQQPGGIISKQLAAGIAGALGAVQVATITAQKFATGGEVKGAGTKTSDSIPAQLSNGEYVVQADAVRGLGVNFMDMINSVKPRKFATGGLVTPQPIATTSTNASSLAQLTEQVQSQEIRVINVETDFSGIQNRVNNVERAGTF